MSFSTFQNAFLIKLRMVVVVVCLCPGMDVPKRNKFSLWVGLEKSHAHLSSRVCVFLYTCVELSTFQNGSICVKIHTQTHAHTHTYTQFRY